MIRQFLRRSEGQGIAEYTVMLALVAAAALSGVSLLGTRLEAMMRDFASRL